MGDREFKQLKTTLRLVWVALGTNVIAIIGAVWFLSGMSSDITHNKEEIKTLKETCIDQTSWKYNDYFTRYLWAERWSQTLPDPPYNTRGVAPNL